MRPRTLSEAYERLIGGEPKEMVFAGFLDTFYGAKDAASRLACIDEEPPLTGDPRLDALAGACAEYLAKLFRLPRVPGWVSGPQRVLAEPWFTFEGADAPMKAYLVYASPAEFRSRNIFMEERPLRRARSAQALRQAMEDERRAPAPKRPGA